MSATISQWGSMVKWSLAAAAVGALAWTGVIGGASRARAATCTSYQTTSWAEDYTVIFAMSSSCNGVGARHYYNPVWSSNNYWTPWRYGSTKASSVPTAELVKAQGTDG